MNWHALKGQSRTHYLIQGEIEVSDCADTVITTLVGSCVAACIYDTERCAGGMNHFLLPQAPSGGNDMMYGINQMELLINSLLKLGARKSNLKAKIFGGNAITNGLTDAGLRNSALAETFLRDENIPIIASALRGDKAQRIQFHPVTGRARMKYIHDTLPVETQVKPAPVTPIPNAGELELF